MKNIIDKIVTCRDIHVSLDNQTVPEYDTITEIGMMVQLSLHLRGLPLVNYKTLKLVADYYLKIPSIVLKNILYSLADIDFIKLSTEGNTIKKVLPMIPYFDDVYANIGEFTAVQKQFNEHEQFALEILHKLSKTPIYQSNLFELGADRSTVERTLFIGKSGGLLIPRKARGKDIIISPTYFMDNADLYTELVAKTGAKSIEKINSLLQQNQGWPLALIEEQKEINGIRLNDNEICLLKRLAEDGAIKPPSIKTSHHGNNYFMFTPTPGNARIHPGKKEIYERALALISAVRQGQLLPSKYRIRSPYYLLTSFNEKGFLRANTEAFEQYKKLAVIRMCKLEDQGNGWYKLLLNDTPENHEALTIAISLLKNSASLGTEINDDARFALQKDQDYVESLLSSKELRLKKSTPLDEETTAELDELLLGGFIE